MPPPPPLPHHTYKHSVNVRTKTHTEDTIRGKATDIKVIVCLYLCIHEKKLLLYSYQHFDIIIIIFFCAFFASIYKMRHMYSRYRWISDMSTVVLSIVWLQSIFFRCNQFLFRFVFLFIL